MHAALCSSTHDRIMHTRTPRTTHSIEHEVHCATHTAITRAACTKCACPVARSLLHCLPSVCVSVCVCLCDCWCMWCVCVSDASVCVVFLSPLAMPMPGGGQSACTQQRHINRGTRRSAAQRHACMHSCEHATRTSDLYAPRYTSSPRCDAIARHKHPTCSGRHTYTHVACHLVYGMRRDSIICCASACADAAVVCL